MKTFSRVSVLFLALLCLVCVSGQVHAQGETRQMEISKQEMESLNNVITSFGGS